MKSRTLMHSRTLVLLAIGAMPSVTLAQGGAGKKLVADVNAMKDAAAEAPLPDVDAIEKGQNPPASVSFRPLDRRKMDESNAEGSNGPQNNGAAAPTNKAAEGINRPTKVSRVVVGSEGDAENSLEAFAEGEPAAPVQVPELHTVAAGDTLWSLCKTFYNDPWSWPQLWSLNPLVTNPHWIFPGDVLRLKSTDGDPNAALARGDDGPSGGSGLLASSSNTASSESSILVREIGFLDTGDLKAAGRLSGSREEKIMLSTGDQAYVVFPKDKPLVAGERYSVFQVETDRPILDPKTQKPAGYIVRVYGEILVEQIADDKTGRGVLGQMTDPVERGFFVSNRVKPFKRVDVRPSNVNLQANVIASFMPTNLLSAANFVVLSRGANDGIEVGNRTYVIRRGDGYARVMEGWEEADASFPKEVVAELVVVDVKEKMAVAWITRSTKEIRVGEVTEMRKGY